jgi:hypothetical protein
MIGDASFIGRQPSDIALIHVAGAGKRWSKLCADNGLDCRVSSIGSGRPTHRQEPSMLDQTTSIDNILRQIRRELCQLPYLVTLLADEPVEVHDVWHWRWESLIESIERLCQQHREGSLSGDQEREFLAVTKLLADGRAAIESLGCRLPLEIDQLAGGNLEIPGDSLQIPQPDAGNAVSP